jgi:SAM-dependent methyltransferase
MLSRLPDGTQDFLLYWSSANSRLPESKRFASYVSNRHGLEIGGPSRVFNTALPVYRKVRSLDNVNFSHDTIWEGSISTGKTFRYARGKAGHQYTLEASDLSAISTGKYEFVLSSNCLEHMANPIKGLLEWKRVIKPGGSLIVIVPRKENNFDHRRPTTKFEHLLRDYEDNTDESDLTHLDEILALHDLALDPAAGTITDFTQRSLENFKYRALHHHVFDTDLLRTCLQHAGLEFIFSMENKTDIFALARRPLEISVHQNVPAIS